MEHSYGACSQQALIVITLLRDLKISYRSVLFPHHYALEVNINNHWYYFDTNREPKIHGEQRLTDNWHDACDSAKQYYLGPHADTADLNYTFGIGQKMRY